MGKGWGYGRKASKFDILKHGLRKILDNEHKKIYTYDNYNYYGDWFNIKIIYNKQLKTKQIILFNKYLKPYKEDISNLKSLDQIIEYLLNNVFDTYSNSNDYKENVILIKV